MEALCDAGMTWAAHEAAQRTRPPSPGCSAGGSTGAVPRDPRAAGSDADRRGPRPQQRCQCLAVKGAMSPDRAVLAAAAASLAALLFLLAPAPRCGPPPPPERTTIWDVGFNTGADAAFYLSLPQRFRVVAVEANPSLFRRALASPAFAPHIASGRLRLLNLAVRRRDEPAGHRAFYINALTDEWSSLDRSIGCRTRPGRDSDDAAPGGEACTVVRVPTATCAELFAQHGTGDVAYLKIDVEGRDFACLSDLDTVPVHLRPTYVSVEEGKRAPPAPFRTPERGPAAAEYVQALLHNLSYPLLKRVAQHEVGGTRTSGGLPPDAMDVLAGKAWSPLRPSSAFADDEPGKWFDWHGVRVDLL
ncbi:hypothetical protein DFJ74DRAFT_675576 [Hyaloraphidium curvatum]|nr:hypothetical protein DFJ74DRAFT_675576 [Hyaloraphidium curvatum]